MRLLTAKFEPGLCAGRGLDRPLLEVAALGLFGIAAALSVDAVGLGRGFGHAAASALCHAAFVAAGWVIALDGAPEWRGPAFRVGLALLSASLAARATPAGALLFLLAPLALAREAVRLGTRVRWLGWARPRARTALLVGAAAGLFLGGHLLVTASMTLGYGVAVPSASLYLAALAYDAGANALSAAWLFSGAVFSLRWRSSSFWPAATTATAAALARYLLDPALPRAVEVAAGAVFYLTVLGLACCALRAWSGSVVPGYLSTVAFFAFYRTLHP